MSASPKQVVDEEAVPIHIAGIDGGIVGGATVLQGDVKPQHARPVWLQASEAAKAVIQSWASGGSGLSDYANVFVVDSGGNGDAVTVGGVVDLVGSGDLVIVANDVTETGDVTLPAGVSLVGLGSPAINIAGNLLTFDGPLLAGLTLTGGVGAALLVTSSCTVRNFEGVAAASGNPEPFEFNGTAGAIVVKVINSRFEVTGVSQYGAGVTIEAGTTARFYGCEIIGLGGAGGIICSWVGTNVLYLYQCRLETGATAVYASGETHIKDCHVISSIANGDSTPLGEVGVNMEGASYTITSTLVEFETSNVATGIAINCAAGTTLCHIGRVTVLDKGGGSQDFVGLHGNNNSEATQTFVGCYIKSRSLDAIKYAGTANGVRAYDCVFDGTVDAFIATWDTGTAHGHNLEV